MAENIKTFGACAESWISLQTLTDSMVLLRFGLPDFVKESTVELKKGGEVIAFRRLEGINRAGRVVFDNLEPETDYVICFTVGNQHTERSFRTLAPAPAGGRLFKMGIFADIHVSCGPENLYGRLHVESAQLLHLQLRKALTAGCERIAFPGDMTDEGRPEEYCVLAAELAALRVPYYSTLGNHDLDNDVDHNFEHYFGNPAWFQEECGIQLAALDTGDSTLNKASNREVVAAVNLSKPVLFFTHYQLFPDEWIPDANKAISDLADAGTQKMVDKIAAARGVLYTGHKNVATAVRKGRMLALNLPQLTHFPAGHLEADVYADRIRHKFVPIDSEILNEYSRLGTEAARYHSRPGCSCKSEYRDKYTAELWNGEILL